jgi:hypothetical protein
MTEKQHQAFKYLSRLWRIEQEIKDKEFELWSASLASGIRYDKESVQTSASDPMDKIGNLIDEIRREREAYINYQHIMINQIHNLKDGVCEQMLVDRFVRKMTIKQIMTRYGYTSATAYRLFCQSLDVFADTYPRFVRTNEKKLSV